MLNLETEQITNRMADFLKVFLKKVGVSRDEFVQFLKGITD